MLDSCPNKHHHPAPSHLVYSEKAHSQFSVRVQGLCDGKLPSRQYALKALLLHCAFILASHDGCQGWLLFLYQAPWGPCHGHKIVKLTTLSIPWPWLTGWSPQPSTCLTGIILIPDWAKSPSALTCSMNTAIPVIHSLCYPALATPSSDDIGRPWCWKRLPGY